MVRTMIARLKALMASLTPAQYALCAAVFMVTSIGAIALALWFRRKNARGS